VSPTAKPPVAKIIDWGKYNYQRTKQQKKNNANAKAKEMKQIRLGLKISDHDLGVKLNKVVQFFEAGHKVKFTIKYRGRELAHKELGYQLADKIIEKLSDYNVAVDQQPQMAGKQLNFVVRSSTNAKAKNS
jgi:translation initiation factor IF-3